MTSDSTKLTLPTSMPTTAQTVVRAENGDVIVADETGLRMRLSDRVIEDIALRLGALGFTPGVSTPAGSADTTSYTAPSRPVTQEDLDRLVGEDLDCWDINRRDDFVSFMADLPGRQGPRGFLKHYAGGDIHADTAGALNAIFAIGGPRAALASQEKPEYPFHIMAPADDIGAVGHDGVGLAEKTPYLENLREMTHEALVAQALLYHAQETNGRLPLYIVRAETDGSTTARELAKGSALENLLICSENAKNAATILGKSLKLNAVFVDFALEDVTSDPIDYRDGFLALLEATTENLGKLGFAAPKYLTFFECGTQDLADRAILEGQWELSWNAADHNLVMVAPSYMLEIDDDARLTDLGRKMRAAISAEALFALNTNNDWRVPVLHLAEHDGKTIRVTAQCDGILEFDTADPFGSGQNFGFSLAGVAKNVKINSVEIAPDDKKSILITLSAPLKGSDPTLLYAADGLAAGQPYAANAGALRDGFAPALSHMLRPDELALVRRWALPARLPIT